MHVCMYVCMRLACMHACMLHAHSCTHTRPRAHTHKRTRRFLPPDAARDQHLGAIAAAQKSLIQVAFYDVTYLHVNVYIYLCF